MRRRWPRSFSAAQLWRDDLPVSAVVHMALLRLRLCPLLHLLLHLLLHPKLLLLLHGDPDGWQCRAGECREVRE